MKAELMINLILGLMKKELGIKRDFPLAIGLFSGAMTSTPGLAAAQEATRSALTSTGYGAAYPFAMVLMMIFVKILALF